MLDDAEYFNQRIGTTLRGKWRLEALLGHGGMAAVYVAVHTIGHRVAIKILHPEVAASPELRARFEQEAHAVNRFSHPGSVTITDYDIAEDGCPFLVMELLEGEPLQALLDRVGRVPADDVLRFSDELLDVLAAAHAQGIVHRDIKPDNLFVLRDGRLKVLDFGIARMKQGAPRALHTRTGMAMGTITYMPPEQVRGEHVDARADIFAVGATMFRLLTGRRIHQAESHADMLVAMASTPAPPLASAAPELAGELCKVVDCALSFRRDDRYPDALTMQGDVRALRSGKPAAFAAARGIGTAPTVPSVAVPPVPAREVQTALEPFPARAPVAPTIPDSVRPPASVPPASVPPASGAPPAEPTWVDGQPSPGMPMAQAQSLAASHVKVVPLAKPRTVPLSILVGALGAFFFVAVAAIVVAVYALSSTTPSPEASSGVADPDLLQVPDPIESAKPPTKTPGRLPAPVKTGGATPTTTTAPPSTTSPVSTATAPVQPTSTTIVLPTSTAPVQPTSTAVPGDTGKTPPGQDKKDKKDKK